MLYINCTTSVSGKQAREWVGGRSNISPVITECNPAALACFPPITRLFWLPPPPFHGSPHQFRPERMSLRGKLSPVSRLFFRSLPPRASPHQSAIHTSPHRLAIRAPLLIPSPPFHASPHQFHPERMSLRGKLSPVSRLFFLSLPPCASPHWSAIRAPPLIGRLFARLSPSVGYYSFPSPPRLPPSILSRFSGWRSAPAPILMYL